MHCNACLLHTDFTRFTTQDTPNIALHAHYTLLFQTLQWTGCTAYCTLHGLTARTACCTLCSALYTIHNTGHTQHCTACSLNTECTALLHAAHCARTSCTLVSLPTQWKVVPPPIPHRWNGKIPFSSTFSTAVSPNYVLAPPTQTCLFPNLHMQQG